MPDPTQQPPLEPVDEDWTRALAVVAHPDDLEYGTAAAIARWTDQGKQITYCLVTSGEAGIDTMRPEETRVLREEEERRAAALVGVDTVEFLGFPDGIVEYGVPLRRAIAKAVRRHQPDVVITITFQESLAGGAWLNQADHIAVGRATLDAVRDAGNRWVFPEHIADGLQPWGGVKTVLAGSPDGRHGVDVSATYERGIASLRAHEAYLAALRPDQDPTGFLEEMARGVGARLGCTHGVSFEVYRMG
jgi:LmbE family N-acetylglucosaminyl deacetylase